MRVYFTNLGCKLNQAEIEGLAREFSAAGHEVVDGLEGADLHVVNSCTVTHAAARTSRRAARRGTRPGGRLRTVLTGCHASEGPAVAAGLARQAGVDLVVPNDRKHRLLELVHEAFGEPPAGSLEEASVLPVPFVPLAFGNVRGLVKVEDGCNMRCSFCIIPATRGTQRSRPLQQCVDEVAAMAGAGYREVVVTGVQISAYRDGEARLVDLVEALLRETPVERLRLTSIAPWQLDRRLFDLWRNPRLCRHLHLSLQSGCSSTLRRMRRPYSAEVYAALVEEARRQVPGLAVTTDLIVGFPGESDDEFAESLAFVEAQEFAKAHVFPYSPRPGTAAAELPGRLAPEGLRERVDRMSAVAEVAERAFLERHLGRREVVLWERSRRGLWQGLTDNYVRAFARSPLDLTNRLLPSDLVELTGGGLLAVPAAA